MAKNHELAERIAARIFSENDACLDLTAFLRSRKSYYFALRDDHSVDRTSLREKIFQEVLAYI